MIRYLLELELAIFRFIDRIFNISPMFNEHDLIVKPEHIVHRCDYCYEEIDITEIRKVLDKFTRDDNDPIAGVCCLICYGEQRDRKEKA